MDTSTAYHSALENLIASYGFDFAGSLERALQRSNDWHRKRRQVPKYPNKVIHLSLDQRRDLTSQIALDFLMWVTRRITAKSRTVIDALPRGKAAAYRLALDPIRAGLQYGVPLHSRASRATFPRDDVYRSAKDYLFASWRITHLHLSELYVTREMRLGTKDCLLVYVDAEYAVLLDIAPHTFTFNEELFGRLVSAAPQITERYRIRGITGLSHNVTVSDAVKMSKHQVNSVFEYKGKFYVPMGFGLTLSGHRVEDARSLDRLYDEIERQFQKGQTQLGITIEDGCLVISSTGIASQRLSVSAPLS